MAWFFCSDWHLAHANIIKYCRRPFVNEQESDFLAMADRGTIPAGEVRISRESTKLMTDAIIDSVNAVVGENDYLVHAGDLLFAPRDGLADSILEYRNRIVCKNLILIWGNHDDALRDLYNNAGRYKGPNWVKASADVKGAFTAAYDQFMFNVSGQKIFVNHYPARSWDCAHHGAWMLYGHVHDLYKCEDNGKLSLYAEKTLAEKFDSIVGNATGRKDDGIVRDLLDAVAALNGVDLTVDIGVDNVVRGNGVPWGTPWSMEDLHVYMAKKKVKWEERSVGFRDIRPKSTMKGEAANPKF